ncbi:MAG: hypothetical protein KKE77_10515, partial [Alphaproteobacteria bacterium]|nr:hypothetical protein [Alphaproteobacteria bacterium]
MDFRGGADSDAIWPRLRKSRSDRGCRQAVSFPAVRSDHRELAVGQTAAILLLEPDLALEI